MALKPDSPNNHNNIDKYQVEAINRLLQTYQVEAINRLLQTTNYKQ